MIIAYYPGAGGNRYYLMTQGQGEFESGKIYDQKLQDQDFKYRYLDAESKLDNQDLILTHCVNVPLLKKLFPKQTEIVLIKSDMIRSIQREWVLQGQFKEHDMPDPVENALASINFHCRYYNSVPMDDTGATLVVDVDHDQSKFAIMMRQELNDILSETFETALSMTAEHSDDHASQGFKSKFLDDAEKMKLQLDKVSPSLCLAKWKQVSLHLPTGLNNSCYHPPLHRISIEDIQRSPSGLHNTKYKKEQRKLMLNGKRPSECSYCWAMEDAGKLSDRHYRSGEPWAAVDFGKIVSSNWDDDIVPSYVEVNFNNACNLRCSYCSPQFSSSWADEVNRLGGYPTSTEHNAPSHFAGERRPIPAREQNPYVDAFWEWWPALYPQLRHFRMTGGEPLMDKNTYKVFDYVLALPKPDLHLNVTSNFSVETALFEKYLDYVKRLCNTNIEHFMQYVSLDSGRAHQAEYIRHGLDFDRMYKSVHRFLHEIPYRNSLTFIITMNNLSVTGLRDLMEMILNLRQMYSTTYQRVWFDTPVLRQPAWQSLQILPESYAVKLEQVRDFMLANMVSDSNPYHGFKDFEVQRLERDIAWMRSGQQQNNIQAQADFYRFFAEHDRRRGTDFLQTFPEMSSWWNECKYHAR